MFKPLVSLLLVKGLVEQVERCVNYSSTPATLNNISTIQSDGKCYRLYTEADFLKLPIVSKPEIQRVSLTFALLHLMASGQEDIWKFEYMDPPNPDSSKFLLSRCVLRYLSFYSKRYTITVKMALLTLHGLGAVDTNRRLTPLGKQMSTFPLDPLYARVLLAAFDEGCPKEVIDLVALLGSRDSLLHSGSTVRDEANAARSQFIHRTGDHFMLLNVLRGFEEVDKVDQKQWCRTHFINFKTMGMVLETRRQLRERCDRLKLDPNISCGDQTDPVLSACMTGMFGNTALLQPDGSYRHALSRQVS